jgi:hypothetical protein
LHVREAPLDLDVKHLIGPLQDEVCGLKGTWTGRDLELRTPGSVSGRGYCCRQSQLPRIAQWDGRHRKEAQRNLVTAGCGESAADFEGHRGIAGLGLADRRLTHIGAPCELSLTQTRAHSGCQKLTAETSR